MRRQQAHREKYCTIESAVALGRILKKESPFLFEFKYYQLVCQLTSYTVVNGIPVCTDGNANNNIRKTVISSYHQEIKKIVPWPVVEVIREMN